MGGVAAGLGLWIAAAAAHSDQASTAGPSAPNAPGAYSEQGADTCLGCHANSTVTGIFHTKHGRPRDPAGPFGPGGLQCEACHGPGGAHVKAGGGPLAGMVDFGPKAAASPRTQNAKCLACHQANAAHAWATGTHAASNVACASCHRAHTTADPMAKAASQIEICTGCHLAQAADLLKPSHHPLPEGKMTCTACHAPHGSTAPAELVRDTVNDTCTACHAEFRGPFLWEHQPVGESCTNCHEAHGSVQSSLLKMRPPYLCQTCHEGAGHPSVANTPQGLAGGASPSTYLLVGGCLNCHSQIHGSNHPSGRAFMR